LKQKKGTRIIVRENFLVLIEYICIYNDLPSWWLPNLNNQQRRREAIMNNIGHENVEIVDECAENIPLCPICQVRPATFAIFGSLTQRICYIYN
jgi:hypothetical protein